MKNVFFVIAFILLGTLTFANNSIENSTKLVKEKVETLKETSCTVIVQFGESTSKITHTCDCTQTEACDAAYAIARLAAIIADKLN